MKSLDGFVTESYFELYKCHTAHLQFTFGLVVGLRHENAKEATGRILLVVALESCYSHLSWGQT